MNLPDAERLVENARPGDKLEGPLLAAVQRIYAAYDDGKVRERKREAVVHRATALRVAGRKTKGSGV